MSGSETGRVRNLLVQVAEAWAADAGSDVVWTGEYDGKRGVRMRQQVRDYTTVWFDVGQRTLGYEAFLLPDPPGNHHEVYRQCLVRNARPWRAHVALDRNRDLVIRGRCELAGIDGDVLEEVLGAVYELVEVSFAALVAAAFGEREKDLLRNLSTALVHKTLWIAVDMWAASRSGRQVAAVDPR